MCALWNPDAMCGGHRAQDRAIWCIQNCGLSENAAQQRVMSEFPDCFQDAAQEWDGSMHCEGHRAEDRARWLVLNKGLSQQDAQAKVMSEFPLLFRKRTPLAWKPDVMCDGHTAAARAQWVVENKGLSLAAAQRQVMGEFPNIFGSRPLDSGAGSAVSALGGASAAAVALVSVPPADPELLVWADEFDYTGPPDPAKWTYDVGGHGWGNHELQYYTHRRNNAWVSDGALHINAVREDFEGCKYTSARLVTKARADFKYGRVEVRVLLPSARGTWAAAWMLPTDNNFGIWPKSGEIDIMEHVGYDPGNVHGTVHTDAFNHMKGTQVGRVTKVALPEWHTYAVEWSPSGIFFMLDGKQYHHFAKKSEAWQAWPFDHRFHIILNLAVGGDWGGQKGIDEEAFRRETQTMKVQWVRVYRLNK